MMRFDMRAAQADREGYYYTRWDKATPISVVAETKRQAINKAAAALGDARPGYCWVFVVDSIREPTPDPEATTGEAGQ